MWALTVLLLPLAALLVVLGVPPVAAAIACVLVFVALAARK